MDRGAWWPRVQGVTKRHIEATCIIDIVLWYHSNLTSSSFLKSVMIWLLTALGAFHLLLFIFSHSLSHVLLFATPQIVAHQASLSFTISQSLLKLMSIESVMPFKHLILCCPLLLPSVFPNISGFSNENTQDFPKKRLHRVAKVLISALASVLPMNI